MANPDARITALAETLSRNPDFLAKINGLLRENDNLRRALKDYQGYVDGVVKYYERDLDILRRLARDQDSKIDQLRTSAEITDGLVKNYERELEILKNEVKNRDWEIEIERINQKNLMQDQAVQALVETHCCAVEVQTSDTSFEKACQASCSNGDRPAC